MKFWIPWIIDSVIAVVVLYFFIVGLIDGSVSSSNMRLWAMVLLGLGCIMGGSLWLKFANHINLAMVFLLIPAVPAIIFCILMTVVFVSGARWN
ncbi:MAG: osmoprotectant transporter permease [Spirochaetes bacterium]|nr:osmoprotectant transporter permease [Spirochaetota bacterium]